MATESNLTINGNLTVETGKIKGTLEKLDLSVTTLNPLIDSSKIQYLDTNKLKNTKDLYVGDVDENEPSNIDPLSDRTNLKAILINEINPTDDLVLKLGQIGYKKENNNYRAKIGDGETKFSLLPYANLGLTEEYISTKINVQRSVIINALKTPGVPSTERGGSGEGTPTAVGLTKLYDTVSDSEGNNTDGTLTQKGIKELNDSTIASLNTTITDTRSDLVTIINNTETRLQSNININTNNITTNTNDIAQLDIITSKLSDDGLIFNGKAITAGTADKAITDINGNSIIDTYALKNTFNNYYTITEVNNKVLNTDNVKIFTDVISSFSLPGESTVNYLVIYTINDTSCKFVIKSGGSTISGETTDKLSGTYIKLN